MVDQTSISISETLTNALSRDKTFRESAEAQLSKLALQNYPLFLFNLATELADEGKNQGTRQLAATYIKNSLQHSNELREIWHKLDSAPKDQIKNLILSTLATTNKSIMRAAGIVISGIVKVEQPLHEKWPTLIATLCQSAFNENVNIILASIESLGYICEELTLKTIDSNSVDSILSALIQNISGNIQNKEIVNSGLKALLKCVKLAEKNFSRDVSKFFLVFFGFLKFHFCFFNNFLE
jgi:importin subunit beta-1